MDKLFILLQRVTPQFTLTWICGKLAHCEYAWVKNPFIRWFIRHYAIDMSIAAEPDPHNYKHFNDFFTRRLTNAARPIAQGEKHIIAPVDGSISQLGRITDGRIFQAKGFDFSAEHLLGGSQKRAAAFNNGRFLTAYLAPKDYHRVHMPFAGQLREMVYIPGRLFSVNSTTTQHVGRLFARNERVVALFDTEIGEMAVVMVGAMIVGSIHTQWAGTIAPPRLKRPRTWNYPADEQAIKLSLGEELGYFDLGSTVILLFASDRVQWDGQMIANSPLIMGQPIAHIN